jgi:tRNA-dihydrouridine synthase C
MEGVTDAPMRALLTERGGFAFCVTEFLRVSQDVPGRRAFLDHVPELARGSRTSSGVPVQVQLLGGDPGKLAEAAARACEAGALAIDLNFGCPAPLVNRHDGGATLLKHPARIRAIVAAVRGAVPAGVPVSAKLRLGWDSHDPIHENTERAAEGGASWITIHGRSKEQGYAPPAYWRPIGAVRARLGIPVVANGDLWTLDDFRRCRDETGCEHYMLGRSALADPDLALRCLGELGAPVARAPSPFGEAPADWNEVLRRFCELGLPFAGSEGYLVRRIKQWLRLAQKGRRLDWVEGVKRAQSLAELFGALESPA